MSDLLKSPEQLLSGKVYQVKYQTVNRMPAQLIGKFVRLEVKEDVLWLYFLCDDDPVLQPIDWNPDWEIDEIEESYV